MGSGVWKQGQCSLVTSREKAGTAGYEGKAIANVYIIIMCVSGRSTANINEIRLVHITIYSSDNVRIEIEFLELSAHLMTETHTTMGEDISHTKSIHCHMEGATELHFVC